MVAIHADYAIIAMNVLIAFIAMTAVCGMNPLHVQTIETWRQKPGRGDDEARGQKGTNVRK